MGTSLGLVDGVQNSHHALKHLAHRAGLHISGSLDRTLAKLISAEEEWLRRLS